MKGLEDPDALALHQAHPAKLVVDAGAGALSLWLLWRGRTITGLAVHYLVPMAASLLVLQRDLSRLRSTAAGKAILAMPQGGHAIRAAGDTLMVTGARKHKPKLMVLGGLGVVAGLASGFVAPRLSPRRAPVSD
ncbi:MAG TPA: hypothetical protein VFW71_01790 [Actinomycetota bacterium]|nr:hypothetical protein [Actinomycetota bacterium]